MNWRRPFILVCVPAAAALLAWSASSALSQDAAEVPVEPAGLSVGIHADLADGTSTDQVCYFDAKVTLQDGKVGVVESMDMIGDGRVRTGDLVRDLPAGLDEGKTIPLPVFVGEDGLVHGGYAQCEEAGSRGGQTLRLRS